MGEEVAVTDIAKRLRNGPSVTELYAAAHEIEQLRAVIAELLSLLQKIADNEGPWGGQAESVITRAVLTRAKTGEKK
jgi:hypothetical protein